MKLIDKWHAHMKNPNEAGLREILHEDCVFYSPVVFTPQKGREAVMQYLMAAGNVFGGESKFRYVREIISDEQILLEFEAEIDGKYVNGADIIRASDDGRIIEFKVMVRPLQAVNAVWEQMGRVLASAPPESSGNKDKNVA